MLLRDIKVALNVKTSCAVILISPLSLTEQPKSTSAEDQAPHL